MRPKSFKYHFILVSLILLNFLFTNHAKAQIDRQSQRRGSVGNPGKITAPSQRTTSQRSSTYFSQTQSSAETKNIPSPQSINEISQKAQNLITSPSSDGKKVSERFESLAEERKDLLWGRYVEPGSPANAYNDAGGGKAGQNAQHAFELWGQGYSVKKIELQGGLIVDAQKGRVTNQQGQDVTAAFLKDLRKDVQITRITFDNGEAVGGYRALASDVLFYIDKLVQGSREEAVETLLIDSNGRPIKLSERKGRAKQTAKEIRKKTKPPIQPSVNNPS